jgi:hypothetical protein
MSLFAGLRIFVIFYEDTRPPGINPSKKISALPFFCLKIFLSADRKLVRLVTPQQFAGQFVVR